MEESERKERDPTPRSKEHAVDTGPGASTSAASQRGAAADTDATGGDKIDVCSENFDPLAALYAPTVRIPVPNIKCFNNVAEYESFLKGGRGRAKPENVEKKRRKAMKGVADPERIARLKSLMVNNPVPEAEDGEGSSKPRERKRHKTPKNVLTRMPLCKGSPLGELYRCVEEKIRVKVHIRTFKGLRGVCSGFVVAFDKFWNMAMVDVDETYREPLLGEAYYHEKALTISRLFEKLKIQESSEADEPAREDAAPEGTGKRLSADPKMASKSMSVHAGGEAEAKLSDVIGAKQDKGGTSLKEQQKKDCRTYGKVHTRHINQLFIRGENVVLVNPQPL